MESEAFLQQKDPMVIFEQWLTDARQVGLKQPDAFTLSTVSQGQPTSRVVLFKGFVGEGFQFFTNYNSQKGQDLSANPLAAANFYWDALGRQIKILGSTTRLSREVSENYWASRPRDSQVAQWVSDQSKEVKDRESLEQSFNQALKEFGDEEIPCPEHWGGYIFNIQEIEFWVADRRRFHDRFHYMKVEDSWQNRRLFP